MQDQPDQTTLSMRNDPDGLISQLLVQLTDLLLEDLQVLQCHFQEPSVHGLELRAAPAHSPPA
jgi:hypothetical protein